MTEMFRESWVGVSSLRLRLRTWGYDLRFKGGACELPHNVEC